MDNEEKLVQLVDKNIDRLIEKLNDLGPGAEHIWSQMVSYQITTAGVTIISYPFLVCFLWGLFYFLMQHIKRQRQEAPGYDDSGLISLIVVAGLASVAATVGGISSAGHYIAAYIYPEAAILREFLQ